jgi:hypothetical protein
MARRGPFIPIARMTTSDVTPLRVKGGSGTKREKEITDRDALFAKQMNEFQDTKQKEKRVDVAKPVPTKGRTVWDNLKKLRKGNIFTPGSE